ncbi:MAG: DNA polymerase III subunit gamma/tau [Patescibacteria group bacterium]
MVFYRKYRPQKFSEIVNQEHIKQVLTNSLASNKFGHGYLFAGPRGIGKTTIARIFAKALNCSGRKLTKNSFEPCNRCLSCKEITMGKSLDLIEIDAASNRGIDEIRDLREKIRFAPTASVYKIYIIDEVHMLTKEAFNALLKTLEEPPKHAIFLMATTEPQKVLPTILSRVQRFDFHQATAAEIEKLLQRVVRLENIKIDQEAIILISQLAFGSYRDGLSLLDQVSSLKNKITLTAVQDILGLAQEKSIFDFIELLAQKNRQKAFELVSKLYFQGVDLENFAVKLIEILRKIALEKIGENQLFDLTQEQQEEVKKLAQEFELERVMLMVEKFVESLPQIKSATLPPLPLEMIIYQLTKEENNHKSRGDAPSEMPVSRTKFETRTDRVAESEGRPAAARTVKVNQILWQKIIQEARTHNHSLAALLRDATIAKTEGETITLAFKFRFHADMISGKKNCQMVESLIYKITGTKYRVTCVVNPEIVINAPLSPDEELLNGAKEVFEVEE